MSKTVDFSKFPNITLVEEIDYLGRSSVVLHFTNGAKLHLYPENDALAYTAEGDPFNEGADNRLTILLNLDSGHHAQDDKTKVMLFPGQNMRVSVNR